MKYTIPATALLLLLASCHASDNADTTAADQAVITQTPVTVTGITSDTMTEYLELNATAVYRQLNLIKASTTGYLKEVNIQPGQLVSLGQRVFTMRTKESQALGNTINALDTSFRFSGMVTIHASVSGYVQELNHQSGDYVQDGEQLATLTDSRSFGFMLNVPFEWRQYVRPGQSLSVRLPDSTIVAASVATALPSVDSVSQSEQVLLRVTGAQTYIPQNVIGKVKLIKTNKVGVVSLPRQAILADESQTDFWVMKMIDSTTAVKVPVKKGLEVNGQIEIVSPVFSAGDRIIVSGNYGLADTAKVKITGTVL
jgi:multidrug resistance efflux pump